MGEKSVGSNIAGVLNATTPLWTLMLAPLAGVDRSVTVTKGIGFGLGFLGVVVIFSPWKSASEIASWGGFACLLASASYAVSYVYMGRFLTGRGAKPLMLAASQLAAGSVLLALALPFAGLERPVWKIDAVVSVLVLGILGTGLAYVLNYRIIQDDGPILASTVTYVLPIVAIALGWLFLRETIIAEVVAGVALVLVGIALTRQPAPGIRRSPRQ
jgi:drug/metabolite transporter (DMT)-like permease